MYYFGLFFFAVGFVLIIITVLSLVLVYLSLNSSIKNNYIHVSQVYINDYTLQFHSPSDNFNSEISLSKSNNRQALPAALTSMIQNDSILADSVIEISTSSLSSKRKRRQTFALLHITFDLYLTSSESCISSVCLNQLSHKNRTTSVVRYEQLNTNNTTQSSSSSKIYWLQYQLTNVIKSSVSFVNVDPKKQYYRY